MPRKARKTQKPALLFVEPPRGGARNLNEPEVRAALYPKSFITEGQSHGSSTLTSWVSPQFDTVHLAAPPARRGRRQCHSVTGVTDRSTQLTRRKKSVCKYPSLSYKRTGDQSHHQPDRAREKKSTVSPVASIPEHQQQGSRQGSRTASCHSAQHTETPKRSCSTLRKRNAEVPGLCDGASCSSSGAEQRGAPSVHSTGKRQIPAFSASPPPAADSRTPDVSGILSPPDVDTPEVLHEERSSSPSSAFLHVLFSSSELSPSTYNQPRDILVADTPERDYGLKVTWRRRREIMMTLKQRGSLSDVDVLIDC